MKKLIFTILFLAPMLLIAEPGRPGGGPGGPGRPGPGGGDNRPEWRPEWHRGRDRNRAEHQTPLHKAVHDLIDRIEDLDDSSFRAADDVIERRGDRGINELDKVSNAANALSRAVRREILRKLNDRAHLRRIAGEFSRLERNEYEDLRRAVEDLNRGSFGVRRDIEQVRQAWRNVDSLLPKYFIGPGPRPTPGPGPFPGGPRPPR